MQMTDVEVQGCLETRQGCSHYHVSETAWQCRTEFRKLSMSYFKWLFLVYLVFTRYNVAVAECAPHKDIHDVNHELQTL